MCNIVHCPVCGKVRITVHCGYDDLADHQNVDLSSYVPTEIRAIRCGLVCGAISQLNSLVRREAWRLEASEEEEVSWEEWESSQRYAALYRGVTAPRGQE